MRDARDTGDKEENRDNIDNRENMASGAEIILKWPILLEYHECAVWRARPDIKASKFDVRSNWDPDGFKIAHAAQVPHVRNVENPPRCKKIENWWEEWVG